MKFSHLRFTICFSICFSLSAYIQAQSPDSQTVPSPEPTASPTASPTPTKPRSLEKHFLTNIGRDQLAIWTAPFKPKSYDTKWTIPLGLTMAGLIATDRYTSRWVSRNGGLPVISRDVSWFGKAYTTGGVAAGFYVVGRLTHNAKARETGLLAAEALIDTGIATKVLKLAAQRSRPNFDNGDAEFFEGGSSFPSGHASSVWSVATVIAYEYKRNPWIKYGAFAAATAVSMSRYSGRNHFLSDIVGGSAIGFLIGRYVVHRYHDTSLDHPKPKKATTLLHPIIAPYIGDRIHGYGARLVWQL
jgi:membrane-associated phospholipid phosphatase